ncbi:MAG: hypothetical protein NZL93_02510 [Chthoniobacterales bacterium]|nr:hypothetical protein [Chthoniobacterales bacterium]
MKCSARSLLYLVGFLLAIFVLVVLILNLLVQTPSFQAEVRKAARNFLGGEIEMGEVRYLPPLGLVLAKVSGRIKGSGSEDYIDFNIEEVHVRLSLVALLDGQFLVDSMILNRANFSVARIEEVSFLLFFSEKERTRMSQNMTHDGMVLPLEERPAEEVRNSEIKEEWKSFEKIRRQENWAWKIRSRLRELRIAEGNLVVQGLLDGGELNARGVHFDAVINDVRGSAEGKFGVEFVELGNFPHVSGLRGNFVYREGVLELQRISGELAGGKISGDVIFRTLKDECEMKLEVKNGKIGLVLEELRVLKGQSKGYFHSKMDIKMENKKYYGDIYVQFVDFEFEPEGEIRDFGRIFRIREFERFCLPIADTLVELRGDVGELERFEVGTSDWRVEAKGEINLIDGSLNFPAHLFVRESILQRLGNFVPECFETSERAGFQMVRFNIFGNLQSPKTDLLQRLGLEGSRGPVERFLRGFLRTEKER